MWSSLIRGVVLVAAGVFLGAVLERVILKSPPPANAAQGGAQGATPAVAGDVAHLKDVVPSQSHAMADVAYHWTNLWFAAKKRNWPLAQFYFDETRSHIQWTIRIRPVRKGPDGKDVDIKSIYESIDSSAMASVKHAIESRDPAQFAAAYKTMLESCYACHKSSGKAFLRPMIPEVPAQSIVNLDPDASWPQ